MTRFIGKLSNLSDKEVSDLALYSGGRNPNSADGSKFKATALQNIKDCVAGKKDGHFKTIHFPSKEQLEINKKNYRMYMDNGNYIKAAHMIHSLQDGIGAHNEYKTCGGHAAPDGAAGAVAGGIVGGVLSGVGGAIEGAINGAVEGAHATDRQLGDADFINAANAVYQTMTGDSRKNLTDEQINNLIDAIVEACGGDESRWRITRPGGGRSGGGGNGGGGGIRFDSTARQFDWLEIFHGWRDRRPSRLG
jgi:hypothetical protein